MTLHLLSFNILPPEKEKSNRIYKINRKGTNSTNKSERNTTTNKPNPNSLSTKNSVIIVGASMVKHLTGFAISKKNHVKIKINPGAITEYFTDLSSQVFGRNWIFYLFIQEQTT